MNIKKQLIITFLSLFLLAVYLPVNAATAKEYRRGKIVTNQGKTIVAVSNRQFVELLEITKDNKIIKLGEVRGMNVVEDLVVFPENDKNYLVITTGRYLIKYDITKPNSVKVILKRDLYQYRKGQYRTGQIFSLAINDSKIYGAGDNGVRAFGKDNLVVEKIFYFEKAYGLGADNNKLSVLGANKELVYDIKSGKLSAEYNIKNVQAERRNSVFDNKGNPLFISDNSVIKADGNLKAYANPVTKNIIFSYGVSYSPTAGIYYVNGYGITHFDNNLNKKEFIKTSAGTFGANSWGVGVETFRQDGEDKVLVFNKSSILLLNKNLKPLAQYKYKVMGGKEISNELKVVISKKFVMTNNNLDMELFGFWPNEKIKISFGGKDFLVTADNFGHAKTAIQAPVKVMKGVIDINGQESKINFQEIMDVK